MFLVFTPSLWHTTVKYNDVSCTSFVMNSTGAMPTLLTKCEKNVAVIANDDVFAAATTLATME